MNYDYRILQEWGQDYTRETDFGVAITLETSLRQTSYMREYGANIEMNTPKKNTDIDVVIPLIMIEALETYSQNEIPQRQVIVDFNSTLLQNPTSPNEEIQSERNGLVKYYRVIDLINNGVTI